MLFYSELIGKSVYSDDQKLLGSLRDIIFINEDSPLVTKIVVQKEHHHVTDVTLTTLRRVNNHIIVTRPTRSEKRASNELSTNKTLLDKQIIDLVGNKVVRVNDVVLQDAPTLSISGIDIGLLGIFRRLGVEAPIQATARLLRIPIPMQLLSWGDISSLELDYGQIKIKQPEEKLAKIHEEDLADYLEMTNTQNADRFLKTLSFKKAAEVVESLSVNYQVDLFGHFEPKKAAEIITLIDPDEAVDILLALDRAKRDKIMKSLVAKKREELHRLMTFSRTPVGKLMTSEYFAVESHVLAKDILSSIRHQTAEFSSLTAIYVLNRDDQLVGVCNPHELILQDAQAPAYKFMITEPIVVLLTTPIEVVMYKFLKYNIPALPVINRDKKILGVITIDDVSDILLKRIQ